MKTKKYGSGDYKRIYLISPRNPRNFWTLQYMVDILGYKSLMTNSAFPLLMALTPSDVSVEYIFVDENAATIDWNMKCDLVAITGYTLHSKRMKEIANNFRKRSIPVAMGGPHASLDPSDCEGYADHLFVGEGEIIWPQFLSDWMKGEEKSRYIQRGEINMKESPVPDWSLTKHSDYLCSTVQTKRGCQYKCDFCDVIMLHGRHVRYKAIDQVMDELKKIYEYGSETVFFLDDIFITSKSYTRELLGELIKWNATKKHPLSFIVQTTVEIAKDKELLQLLADARFYQLFLGIETPRRDSLKEVHKVQNLFGDMKDSIRTISSFGIIPIVGLMVGFDHDDDTIFDEHEKFLEDAASPITAISVVNAPKHTPLYMKLKSEGRVIEDDLCGEWLLSTNIVPKLMTREELLDGHQKLFKKVYELDVFEEKFINWIKEVKHPYNRDLYPLRKVRIKYNALRFMHLFTHVAFKASFPMKFLFLRCIMFTIRTNKRALRQAFNMLLQFMHFNDFVNQKTMERRS